VVVVRAELVEMSVSVTVTPPITAPDTSVTVPATVPALVDCAHVGKAAPTQSRSMRNKANLINIGLRMRHPPGSEKVPPAEPKTAMVGDFGLVTKLVVTALVAKQNCSSLLIHLPP
jgi:hypothetical protein